jgi:hypothetical protein
MTFDNRIVLIPLMPNAVFFALRHGMSAYPLSKD